MTSQTLKPLVPVWEPLASCIAIGVPGLIALLSNQLVLFASLAPTAVMIAQQPRLASTRPYNAIVGHEIGLGAGFFAVWALGIAAQPSVFVVHSLSAPRLEAALIALAIATTLEKLLKAQHPPAGSTTLLAALGSFKLGWHDAWIVLVGAVSVTLTGEVLRRFHPAPQPPAARD